MHDRLGIFFLRASYIKNAAGASLQVTLGRWALLMRLRKKLQSHFVFDRIEDYFFNLGIDVIRNDLSDYIHTNQV